MNRWARNKAAEWPIYRVYGHLFLTASTLVVLFTFSWVIALLFDYMSSIHQFQPAISKMVEKLEVGLFYADTVVCGLMLWRDMIRMFFGGQEGK